RLGPAPLRRPSEALIRTLQPHDFSLPLSAVPALTEQQLADDLTRAMKAREMPRVYVLRGLITAAKNLKVERRGAALAEADLVQLVRREIRKREEGEAVAAKAGRRERGERDRAPRTRRARPGLRRSWSCRSSPGSRKSWRISSTS